MDNLANIIGQFKERFENFRRAQLKSKFDNVVSTANTIIRDLSVIGCPAAYIPFERFPTSKPPVVKSVPPLISIGTAKVPISRDAQFSSVSLPFLLPLTGSNAFWFDGGPNAENIPNLFQTIMMRLALSLPLNLCQFYMIDCDFGRSFSSFNSLQNSKINKELYGANEVSRLFIKLEEIMRASYAGEVGKYPTLTDYNAANPESAKPYHFVFIDDFPSSCPYQAIDQLKAMINNGNAVNAGIYLFINFSRPSNLPREFDMDFFKSNCAWIVSDSEKKTTIYSIDILRNITHVNYVDISIPSNFGDIAALLNEEDKKIVAKTDFYNLEESEVWAGNSSSEALIPVGINEQRNENLYICFAQQDAKNTALVVGATGSGKSKFLRSLILNAALHYSPSEIELYLLDFSGVEFNVYATLPHVKVLATESQREFGFSVLESILNEAKRREILCSKYGAESIVGLRKKQPDLLLPRIIIIIDEFQKLFERHDEICKECSRIITTIIKEYRKFGINLVLSTQTFSELRSDYIPVNQIGNRILYKCSPSDSSLIGLDRTVPQLERTEFYYNDRLGDPAGNVKAKCFWVDEEAVNRVFEVLKHAEATHTFAKKKILIFSSRELPDFNIRPAQKTEGNPVDVSLYLGKSFTVQENDVAATFANSTGDNLLIVGGNTQVAMQMEVYGVYSLMFPYDTNDVSFYYLNFMRPNNSLNKFFDMWQKTPYDTKYASTQADALTLLKELNEELERRKGSNGETCRDIYLSIFAFELSQMFGGRKSEAGEILINILKSGPLNGIYTILQVDTLDNLELSSSYGPVSYFNHRVALQMDGRSSKGVIDTDAASGLSNDKNKYSEHWAYYYNKRKNQLLKFVAYKPHDFNPEEYQIKEEYNNIK